MTKFGKFTYYGNPYIGLFARTNNKVTLAGVSAPDKFSRMADLLNTEFISLSFADSSLIGLYSVMNDHGIVVSSVVDDLEVRKLKKELDDKGIDIRVTRLESIFTAIGNNMAVNNHGAIINPNMANDTIAKELSDALDVDVATTPIGEFMTVGSAISVTNKGFLAHPNITEEQMEILTTVFKTEGGVGTINGGMPFVSLGIVANDEYAIVGANTTGFELHRVQAALGLIK